MKLIWLTDIHLNFLADAAVEHFLEQVRALSPEGILISGDIGEAPDVCDFLQRMDRYWECPIFFVLGNHDYYKGSIENVRADLQPLLSASKKLHYLTVCEPLALTPTTGLIGHDSWADGRLGDYWNSTVLLSDYVLIKELAQREPDARFQEIDIQSSQEEWNPENQERWLKQTFKITQEQRWKKLNWLGDQAAVCLETKLVHALEHFEHVILVTHVPPFLEACWHEGHFSNKDFLPHFACKAVGNILLKTMETHPCQFLTVLCGHTHSSGLAFIRPNLMVKTGGATYRKPQIQETVFVV
ncbi:metallophosphoesterase [Deltaproteobacteria bacterium TL4]